jgi:hypothetical protein
MLGRCSHEFSWPRRATDGHYYQVCLQCAAQYRYDWKQMRRIERVDPAEESAATSRRGRACNSKKPTWVPRARRLKLEIPVRYRAKVNGSWYNGIIENISQSGVLLQGQHPLPQNTLLEMVFEMPEEISGQKNSNVVCQGRVIRLKEPKGQRVGLATSILDYKFLH